MQYKNVALLFELRFNYPVFTIDIVMQSERQFKGWSQPVKYHIKEDSTWSLVKLAQ